MEASQPLADPDVAWAGILGLRAALAAVPSGRRAPVFLARTAGVWRFVPDRAGLLGADAILEVPLAEVGQEGSSVDAFYRFEEARADLPAQVTRAGQAVPGAEWAPFRLYLPIVLGAWRAKCRGLPFVTAHLAQTLDGKIACTNGRSQWIGNSANQHHAHRLRALHDGILVGRRTLELDDPQLTVRHVPGRDPQRVVLSARAEIVRDAARYRAFRGSGATVVCARGAEVSALPGCVRLLTVGREGDTACEPGDVVRTLAQNGVHSIFVEGGAATISSFLVAGAITILHLHIAPMILGSGVAAFSLPEVSAIRDGKRFRIATFTLDGEVLVECRSA